MFMLNKISESESESFVGEHEAIQEEFLKIMLDDVSCNAFPQCLDCAS